MIGASLSGVTFISVPGWVQGSGMTYMPMVLGYLVGYALIAFVLLPVYYRYNVVSIYSFLGEKLGPAAYKTGSLFFLLSRVVGASARLYIVTVVVQLMICDPLGIPFPVTAILILGLIALYSASGGIATIVYTDTLQTALMLVAAAMALYYVGVAVLPEGQGVWNYVRTHEYGYMWLSEGPKTGWKQVIGGMSIAVAMTGLDQDMMQKNLTVSRLVNAQKNMVLLGLNLLWVNLLFLALGLMLSDYAAANGLLEKGDQLFAAVANSPGMPSILASVFFLGLLAAAFSSADSALASLTTAFCVDFLRLDLNGDSPARKRTYGAFMAVIFVVMLLIYLLKADSIIGTLFTAAGYTYGPLLGLFAYALLHRSRVMGWEVLFIGIGSPLLTHALKLWAPSVGYSIGFELLIYNGLFTYAALHLAALLRKS
jgi:Na+/proline symporter